MAQKRTSILYDPVKTMSYMTDKVLVDVSGGKGGYEVRRIFLRCVCART